MKIQITKVPNNRFNIGGVLQTNGSTFGNITHIDAGQTHEENPYDGVLIGFDSQGVPNLVEENEIIWNDYVFSNRLTVPDFKKQYKNKKDAPYEAQVLWNYSGKTFADVAKRIEKSTGADERVVDKIANDGMDAYLSVLAGIQEKERAKEKLREQQEAIDNMTPEEFAEMKQQLELQQQQEEAAQLEVELLNMQLQGMQEQLSEEDLAMMQLQLMQQQMMQQQAMQGLAMAAYGGKLYKLGGGLDEVLEYHNKKLEKKITEEDWNKKSNKEKRALINTYKRKALNKEQRKAWERRYNEHLKVQDYNRKNEIHRKEQLDSALTKEHLKNFNLEELERITNTLKPGYKMPDLKAMSDNDAEKAIDKVYNDILSVTEDNKPLTVGQFNEKFTAPSKHKEWTPTDLKDTNTFKTKYDFDSYGNTVSKYDKSLNPGNVQGNYTPDNEFEFPEGIKDREELENLAWYKDYTDVSAEAIDNAVAKGLKWKYDNQGNIEFLGDVKPSDLDAKLIKAAHQATQRTAINPDKKNIPLVNEEDGVFSFNNEIEKNDGKGSKTKYTAANYYRNLRTGPTGVFHITPESTKERDVYTLSDKDDNNTKYYLEEEMNSHTPNWRNDYTESSEIRTLPDGTRVHMISPNKPLGIEISDLEKEKEGPSSSSKGSEFPKAPTWPYLVGAGILGLSLLYNALTPIDYSNADSLIQAALGAGNYDRVGFRPVGNYLTYNPMDIWYELNRLNANSRATDRAIMNSGANQGAKNAALLANAYNNQISSGNLYRQALEYNDALRKSVEDFNRETNKFNSEGFFKADAANQSAAGQASGRLLEGLTKGYAMRQALEDAKSNAINTGISNLANMAYNYGNTKWNNDLMMFGIKNGAYGNMLKHVSDKASLDTRSEGGESKAKGGNIRRKKNRGISF